MATKAFTYIATFLLPGGERAWIAQHSFGGNISSVLSTRIDAEEAADRWRVPRRPWVYCGDLSSWVDRLPS